MPANQTTVPADKVESERDTLLPATPMTLRKALRSLGSHAFPFCVSRIVEISGSFYVASVFSRLGSDELAASGLVFSVSTVVTNSLIVATYSVGQKIARFADEERMTIFKNGLVYAVSLSALVAGLNIVATPAILTVARQPEPAVALFRKYNTVGSLALIPASIYNIEQQFVLGAERPGLILFFSIGSTVVGSLLATALIPSYHVNGIGLSSLIASIVSAIAAGGYLWCTTPGGISLFRGWGNGTLSLQHFKDFFFLGGPFAIEAGMELITKEVQNLIAGSLGISVLSGVGIANQSLAFVITPAYTIGASVMYRIKNHFRQVEGQLATDDANMLVKAGNIINFGYASLGVLVFSLGGFGAGFLVKPFLNAETEQDPLIQNVANSLLLIFSLSQVPNAVRYVFGGGLYAYDRTNLTMWVGTATLWSSAAFSSFFGQGSGVNPQDSVNAIFASRGVMLACAAMILFYVYMGINRHHRETGEVPESTSCLSWMKSHVPNFMLSSAHPASVDTADVAGAADAPAAAPLGRV